MRGSVVRRCRVCRRGGKEGPATCQHKEADYSIVYRLGSKQKWERIGSNKKDAERRLAEVMSQLHAGTFYKPNDVLFREFCDVWLRDYVGSRQMKDSTIRSYRSIIDYRLKPTFGSLMLSQITSQSVQRFLAEMLEKKSSSKTANSHLMLLKAIFKQAKRWKYAAQDPTEDVAPLKHQKKDMAVLNPSDIPRLLKHADEPHKTLFLTAVLTGMRQGEILGLKWGDIDWVHDRILVRRSLYWHHVGETKANPDKPRWKFVEPKTTTSVRKIVMSPLLKQALQVLQITAPENPHDLIFCNRDHGPLDPRNMVQREFEPALKRAGLPTVRFHDLRHTFTSLLIAQGENIKFIQSQLGHTSIQTTLDRYGHLFTDGHHGSGERLDQQVFGIPANTRLTEHAPKPRNTTNQDQESVASSPR